MMAHAYGLLSGENTVSRDFGRHVRRLSRVCGSPDPMGTRAPHIERIGGFGTALDAISIARDTASAGAEQTLAYRVVFVGWFTHMASIVVSSSCACGRAMALRHAGSHRTHPHACEATHTTRLHSG